MRIARGNGRVTARCIDLAREGWEKQVLGRIGNRRTSVLCRRGHSLARALHEKINGRNKSPKRKDFAG